MNFEDRLKVALHTPMTINDISSIDDVLCDYDMPCECYISMFNGIGGHEFKRWIKTFVNHEDIL
jgi:hypothetical protein